MIKDLNRYCKQLNFKFDTSNIELFTHHLIEHIY